MAKSINLTPGKPVPTTSIPVSEMPQVPPPAKLPPGVRGNPPLPIGRAVVGVNPSSLTPFERDQLNRVGWQEGQPIPANMQELVTQVEQTARQDAEAAAMKPPVDPSTPAATLKVVDANQLDAAGQARVQSAMQEAFRPMAAASVAAATPKTVSKTPPPPATAAKPVLRQTPRVRVEDVAEAAGLEHLIAEEVPPPPVPEVAQRVARAKEVAVDYGEPERPAQGYVPDVNYTPKLTTPTPAEAATQIRTEEPVAAMANCPHCNWDLARPDIPEPDDLEKQSFLITMRLGDKPFTKRYTMLGNTLALTIRTLTTAEIDACYKQATRERELGEIQSDLDYFERVNRFRLYLQLQRLQTPERERELPDGFTPKSSPNAEGHWDFHPNTDQPLKLVEEYMLKEVLPTESLGRVAYQCVARFNRLVAKLEAMVDDEGFWKVTGAQSS